MLGARGPGGAGRRSAGWVLGAWTLARYWLGPAAGFLRRAWMDSGKHGDEHVDGFRQAGRHRRMDSGKLGDTC